MVQILIHRNIEEYERELYNGGIDCQLTDSIYKCGGYAVGHRYGSDATIVGVYVHGESDTAWMVVQHDGGQLIEIEIPYAEAQYTRWAKYNE